MSWLDDLGEGISDGADAFVDAIDSAIDEGEELIDKATEEAAKWFLEEMLGASKEYIEDGGSEIDNDSYEERSNIGSNSSELDAAQLIRFEPAREYGDDSDELTIPPSRFTSRLSETDADDRDWDAVRLVTDGAIGTIDELATEAGGTPGRTSDRSEDRDNRESGTTSTSSTGLSYSLQFVATTDDDAGRTVGHTPEWTNFNDSDPGVTLVEGSWMDDVSTTVSDDRGSTQRDGASLVQADTTATSSNHATSYDDASTTLSISWLS